MIASVCKWPSATGKEALGTFSTDTSNTGAYVVVKMPRKHWKENVEILTDVRASE